MSLSAVPRRLRIASAGAAVLMTAALVAVVPAPATAQLIGDQVPDRIIVASAPQPRGTITTVDAGTGPLRPKQVDGDASDWIGTATAVGGRSIIDHGEHIYSDHVNDAWGADDGGDAQRLALIDPLREAEERLERLDALQQAAGTLFGAPEPAGVPDHYGDADAVVPDPTTVGDITEVRWALQRGAAGREQALLLVRINQLADADALVVQVNEQAVDGVVDADGLGGVLEAALPATVLDGPVSVVAGRMVDGGFVPLNAAYRPDEPPTIYNERLQALALAEGSVPTATIDVDALRAGLRQRWSFDPGYHERLFTSGANISSDTAPEQGQTQSYGLYIPTSYDPAVPSPLTVWAHYRGGKTHSGVNYTPRLITQLGEEHGNVVATPSARGTNTWYVSEAHQDVLEVMADVHRTVTVDERRRYMSGYSMGGYATWLFTTLYPDLFAAGYIQSGAVTQGMWLGTGPDDCPVPCLMETDGGDADAQLTFRALANLRHVPMAIDHGTFDELVPITGIERMALSLTELGYRHSYTRFTGYEHYTQAIVDEWADGAAYLNRHVAVETPRQVTYRVVPQLVDAVNTVTADGVDFAFDPDGAYWIDDIEVAEGAAFGEVDATALGVAAEEVTTLSIVGVGSAATVNAVDPTAIADPTNQTTPFTRTGLDWMPTGPAPLGEGLELDLTGVAAVTVDAAAIDLFARSDTVVLRYASDGPATITVVDGRGAQQVAVDGSGEVEVRRSQGRFQRLR